MPLFTICNRSLRCVCEVSAQNTPQFIYYIILKLPLNRSRNMLFVSLNANELLFPAPFSRIEMWLYSLCLRYSAKNLHLVLIIMSIMLKS